MIRVWATVANYRKPALGQGSGIGDSPVLAWRLAISLRQK
jgi:hypothetical protein